MTISLFGGLRGVVGGLAKVSFRDDLEVLPQRMRSAALVTFVRECANLRAIMLLKSQYKGEMADKEDTAFILRLRPADKADHELWAFRLVAAWCGRVTPWIQF